MEEDMIVMITRNPHNYSTWKLYDNPFYYPQSNHHHLHHCHHHHRHHQDSLSARKLAACLWDLTFIRSIMDSELDMARAKIHELKVEIEFERRARRKVEAINKKLCKQILDERKRREAVEHVCEKLAKEIATEKVEADRMKKDIVEERKMLKMAEMMREERVQMKLSEAKILFEEKLSELECKKLVAEVCKLETSPTSRDEKDEKSIISVVSSNNVGVVGTCALVNK